MVSRVTWESAEHGPTTAEEARWPEDKAEYGEKESVVDGVGPPAEFEVAERDVQYEKG